MNATTPLLFFALLSAPADDAPAAPAAALEVTYDLEQLTPAEATHLEGRRVRFRVRRIGSVERRGGFDVYRVMVRDRANDLGTVWLYPDQDAAVEMVVEARLVAHRYRSGVGSGGLWYPAYTSYRLKEALRVGP
jgi:hypothetical protein